MSKSGKVLVVDDYESNLRGLGLLLEQADYTVLTATNGRDALEIVSARASGSRPARRAHARHLRPGRLRRAQTQRRHALDAGGADQRRAGASDAARRPRRRRRRFPEQAGGPRGTAHARPIADAAQAPHRRSRVGRIALPHARAHHRSPRSVHRRTLRSADRLCDRARPRSCSWIRTDLDALLSRRVPSRHRQDRHSRSRAAQEGTADAEGVRPDEAASRRSATICAARSAPSTPSARSSGITTSGSTAAAIRTDWPATASRCSRRSSASSTCSTR